MQIIYIDCMTMIAICQLTTRSRLYIQKAKNPTALSDHQRPLVIMISHDHCLMQIYCFCRISFGVFIRVFMRIFTEIFMYEL